MNAASAPRLELTSNCNTPEVDEADGTGGIDDPTALPFKRSAVALLVGVACAGMLVARKPRESYDFGNAVALAAIVMTVAKPCWSWVVYTLTSEPPEETEGEAAEDCVEKAGWDVDYKQRLA